MISRTECIFLLTRNRHHFCVGSQSSKAGRKIQRDLGGALQIDQCWQPPDWWFQWQWWLGDTCFLEVCFWAASLVSKSTFTTFDAPVRTKDKNETLWLPVFCLWEEDTWTWSHASVLWVRTQHYGSSMYQATRRKVSLKCFLVSLNMFTICAMFFCSSIVKFLIV